jgi:hypothetical protein
MREWRYKDTTLKQNTAHKATETIKGTLHTMNTTQKEVKLELSGQLHAPVALFLVKAFRFLLDRRLG